MFDISICIPTFNRSRLLQECLDHLAHFNDTSFELIVGDNASEDDTQAVLHSMSERFPHFVNLRHKTNIGFARNMDSVLRRSSRKYVYILNDDDMVFEEALKLSVSVMNANEQVAAIVGKYLSLRTLDSATRVDYSDAVATTILRGGYAALLGNLSICDGHPIIRRDIFERYCAYLDRTGTLIPLYFTLLQYGNIIAINKPFFQHRTTNESLTSRMAEAWFLDMANADIELAISKYVASLPVGSMQTARQQLLQLLYLQAARMSNSRNEPYLLWLFLRRLMAVEGASEDLLINCEYNYSHDFLVGRISTILNDSELDMIHYVETDITCTIIRSLATVLPKLGFVAFDANIPNEEIHLLICENSSDANGIALKVPLIAINDIFEQVRLTHQQACLAIRNQRLIVQYTAPDTLHLLTVPSRAFQVVCAPYSEAA